MIIDTSYSRYILCDAEILRENKLFVAERKRDFSNILSAAGSILTSQIPNNQLFIDLHENAGIIENCVDSIIMNNCLDTRNRLRRSNNYLIIGKYTFSIHEIPNTTF